jgi:hypothetical protein
VKLGRLQKTAILTLLFAAPVAAGGTFHLQAPCFSDGTRAYRVIERASPDYRVRIDNAALRPDLRMRLVESAEIADFVLTDGAQDAAACREAAGVRTIALVGREGKAADVTIALSAQADGDGLGLYVNSSRFSPEAAAALFAVMWTQSARRDAIAAR